MTNGNAATAIFVAIIAAVPATIAAIGTVVRALGAKDDRKAFDEFRAAFDEHAEDDAAWQEWILARLDGNEHERDE